MDKMCFCDNSGGLDELLCCVHGDWWGLVVPGSLDHRVEAVGGLWETDVVKCRGLVICFGHFLMEKDRVGGGAEAMLAGLSLSLCL